MHCKLIQVVLLAVLASCARAPEVATGLSVSTDSAGITITQNRAPLLTGAESWTVQLQPLTEIGANQKDSSHVLHIVVGATRLSDGRIVIANVAAPAIRWYDAKGNMLQSAGRAGDGPGEFAIGGEGIVSLTHSWRIAGDTIAAWAPSMKAGRLLLFSPDARYVRTVDIELYQKESTQSASPSSQSSSAPSARARPPQVPQLFAPLGTGYAATVSSPTRSVVGAAGTVNRDSTMLLVISPDGKVGAEVGWRGTSFTRSVAIRLPGAVTTSIAPLTPAFAARFAVSGGDGRIYYGYSDRYEIASYDDRGALRQLVRRDFTRVAATAKEKEQFRQNALAAIPEGPLRKPMELALDAHPYEDSLPVFRRFVVDEEGMLWVQPYVLEGVASAAWSVFDKSGRWVTDVDLPTAWGIEEIGSDYIIAVEKDAFNVEIVRLFRLKRS